MPSNVPCRVLLEFGDRRAQQTHDIQDHETCGDLIKAVGLKSGEFQVVAIASFEPLADDEKASDHFRAQQVVHIVRVAPKVTAVATGPVISGSKQHLL
jgi:hypothetical protein